MLSHRRLPNMTVCPLSEVRVQRQGMPMHWCRAKEPLAVPEGHAVCDWKQSEWSRLAMSAISPFLQRQCPAMLADIQLVDQSLPMQHGDFLQEFSMRGS